MTSKTFVMSIYKEAFCQGLDKPDDNRIAFVVYSNIHDLYVLGWSNYSATNAWKVAAKTLQKEMLEDFKK